MNVGILGFCIIAWRQVARIRRRFGTLCWSHRVFQKNGRCKRFGYITVKAWEEFKCLEMWVHQSGDWSDNVLFGRVSSISSENRSDESDNTSRNFGDLTIHFSERLKSTVALRSGNYFCCGALCYRYCYSVHTKYVMCAVNSIFILVLISTVISYSNAHARLMWRPVRKVRTSCNGLKYVYSEK